MKIKAKISKYTDIRFSCSSNPLQTLFKSFDICLTRLRPLQV